MWSGAQTSSTRNVEGSYDSGTAVRVPVAFPPKRDSYALWSRAGGLLLASTGLGSRRRPAVPWSSITKTMRIAKLNDGDGARGSDRDLQASPTQLPKSTN